MDKEKRLTPLKAIRKFCIQCQGESMKRVRQCQNVNCVLWGFRMGHKPFSTKDKVGHHSRQERSLDGHFLRNKRVKIPLEKRVVTVSEAVIVPKKKWDEIQEKLKGKNGNEKDR